MTDLAFKLSFLRQYTEMDSIKLTGALINSMLILNPVQKEYILNNFVNGNVSVTTPYPYKNCPYLPMPPIYPVFPVTMSVEEKKEYMKNRKKKIKTIQLKDLKNILKSYENNSYKNIYIDDLKNLQEDELTNTENYLEEEIGVNILNPPLIDSEEKNLIFTQVYTKEYSSIGKIYYSEKEKKIYGDQKWFVVTIKNDDNDNLKNMVNASLKFLEDMGLSGRRNIGKGKFEIESLALDTDFKLGFRGEGAYLLLSEYIPSLNDMQNIDFEKSSYLLGIFSGIDKNGSSLGIYRYFKSGSVLYLKNDVEGITVYEINKRVIAYRGSFLKVT